MEKGKWEDKWGRGYFKEIEGGGEGRVGEGRGGVVAGEMEIVLLAG